MKLWQWVIARHQGKERMRYLRERARQEALTGQDVEEGIRDTTRASTVVQQGLYGPH